MPTQYLPSRDAELSGWAGRFAEQISADPQSFGLTDQIAATYTTKAAAFKVAYEAAVSGETRGRATVFRKDELKAELVDYTRQVVRSVQACMSVTNAQRQALGITIRANPVRIPRPEAAPRLNVTSVVGRTLSVKLRDAETPQMGKPRRIAGANIFSFIGDAPPLSVNDWMLHASVTRTRLNVTFPATVPPGAKVWLTARWFNPRSQAGPMSDPISIVFGAARVESHPMAA